MVIEKPMDRAAEPRRPFRLSSVTAKTQTTNCMVRNTSTVVAIPRLMPGCNCTGTKENIDEDLKDYNIDFYFCNGLLVQYFVLCSVSKQ